VGVSGVWGGGHYLCKEYKGERGTCYKLVSNLIVILLGADNYYSAETYWFNPPYSSKCNEGDDIE
jgi:hypothetical protein